MHVQLQCQKVVLTEGGVFVDVITFEIDLNVIVFLNFALLKIRCHASPYRKPDEGIHTETPGCPNFDQPLPKKCSKCQSLVL